MFDPNWRLGQTVVPFDQGPSVITGIAYGDDGKVASITVRRTGIEKQYQVEDLA